MLKALEEIEPVMLESVPVNSLAREFVGEATIAKTINCFVGKGRRFAILLDFFIKSSKMR